MKSTVLWALVVLNAVLLCTFIGRVTHDNSVLAQAPPAGQVRRMGDYLVVSGEIEGGAGGVVYIVDTSNEILGGMAYDDARGAIDVMPTIDLKRIFTAPAPAPAHGK